MEDNAVAQSIDRDSRDGRVSTHGLAISVLGSPRVTADGVPLAVDTRKAIALLVYLAVSGRPQSRDRLAGLLWPEYDTERARAALRRTLSALRKALADRWVSADRLAVALDLEPVSVDLADFRKYLDEATHHDHEPTEVCERCAEALTRAVDLYGGPFLLGFSLRDAEPFEEWQSLEAEAVERQFAGALGKLVRAHVARADLDAALSAAQRKLGIDPLDEPTHRQLMQLYAWKGMRTTALQQYRECVAILDRELGVSPLAETTSLYRSISEGGLDGIERTDLVAPRFGEPPPASQGELPLRGRSREWQTMLDAYRGDRGGTVLVLEGEAGIGKTRLARELVSLAEQHDALVLTARSHQGESALPYALIADLLGQVLTRVEVDNVARPVRAEAARLAPAYLPDEEPPPSITDAGGLARFFDAILRLLSDAPRSAGRRLIFLDDLHWADGASLEVLAYVARRLPETPLTLLLSWRSEEVDQDHPLRSLTAEALREGRARTIRLQRLSADDVSTLVRDALDLSSDKNDRVAARLWQETEGIPFFVVEYLAVLSPEAGVEWQMPSTVTDLLRSRVNLAGQTARQVLGAAAVIDRSFDFDTVWRAGGRTELETVDALDELVRHGLVGSRADLSYEFSHDKLRDFIYDSMSPARRRVLHRRVAEAFMAADKRADHSSPLAGLIARHLQLGGLEEEAARYHEVAAQQARAVFANQEALDHYLAALGLGHPAPASLHEGAADMQILLGNYRAAIESLEKAASLVASRDVAVLEQKLGEVHQRRGDYDLSQSHFVVALETVEKGDDRVTEARLLAAMSANSYRKGDLTEAIALADRALETAVVSADQGALAHALNQRGILENAVGDHSSATDYLRRSLGVAEELGDGPGRVAALNNLALAARSRSQIDTALALTHEALTVCTELGDRHREAALRNNLADLLHQQGDEEGAMQQLKQATAILAEIGEEPAGRLPEVWKLVEW
jgi:DNA-binding SARP family transcriptional activator/predicted ATPase